MVVYEKDPNGVDKIYKTKAGSEYKDFYSDTDLENNDRFRPDGDLTHEGSGVYHLDDYSQVRMNVTPDTTYSESQEAIGGNDNDFSDNLQRGYATKSKDWLDIETTIYVNLSSASPSDSELIQKGPTGRHTDPEPGCQGSSYGVRWGTESQANVEAFKEIWHVDYEDQGVRNIPTSVYNGSIKDGNWHGLKYMNYRILVNGKRCRKIEQWFDANGDGSGFVQVNEKIDQGGWGDTGDICNGDQDQILDWAMQHVCVLRTDLTSTNLKFKWISVREIDPNAVSGDTGSGTGSGGGGNQTVGPDGVAHIYQTHSDSRAFVWYMNNSKPFDGHLERGGGSDFTNLEKNDDGSWTPDQDGTTKYNILVDPTYQDAIDACDMDFGDSLQRGYTYKNNDIGRFGVEMTGFFKMTEAVTNEGIFLRGPWNHHPASSGLCCQQAEYDVEIKPNGKYKFTKELQGNITHPDGEKQIPGVSNLANSQWFGIKYVFYIISKDPAKIKLEFWLNISGDKLTWIKVGETTDYEGSLWGERDALCGGDPYQVFAWGGGGMVIKWYNGHIDFKWWSVREIDYTKVADQEPTEPPGETPTTVTEIIGTFSLKRDINITRVSECAGTGGGGGGGGGSGTTVYDVDSNAEKQLADTSTFDHRTRVVEHISTVDSDLIGVTVHYAEFKLRKVGSPSSAQHVRAKIYDSDGNTICEALNNYNPNDLPTSLTFKSFDFSNNTHAFVLGDRIGVSYLGTSSSNYVMVGYNEGGAFPDTGYQQYENGAWETKLSRDIAGVLKT